MSTASAIVEGVMHDTSVRATAVFGADRSVLQRGFGDELSLITEVAVVARTVLRDTRPEVRALDLVFSSGRLVVSAHGDAVVVIGTHEGIDVALLLALVDAASSAGVALAGHPVDSGMRRRTSRPVGADASATTAAAHLDQSLSLANAILVESRQSFGGPVIRNYLKKARNDLADAYPWLDLLEPSLAGAIGNKGLVEAPADVASGIGAWIGRFLAVGSTVAPDLHRLDPVAIAGPARAEALRTSGFFEAFAAAIDRR